MLNCDSHDRGPKLKWVLIVSSAPMLRIDPMLLMMLVTPVVLWIGVL